MSDNFNAINAKIGVLRKGIFKQEDYEKILSFSKREDIISYIKNNPIYKEQVIEYNDGPLKNRYMTEYMIHKSEIFIFNKLKHFLLGDDKKIIDAMLTRYEFEDIKIILRSIVEDEKIDLAHETLMYNMNTHVDYDRLSKCESIHHALEILKKTPYKRAFVSLADEDVLRLHFHVEMNLDNLYFNFVRNATQKLSKKNLEIMDFYFASLIDTINIQWIIRAKKYYNLSNAEIYNYSIRHGKYIKGELLKNLVYSNTAEEVIAKLRNTNFGHLYNDANQNMLAYRNIQAYVYKRQLKSLKNYQNSISTFLRFVLQVLIQNENMIRIAEAKKYDLDKDEIRAYLIQNM